MKATFTRAATRVGILVALTAFLFAGEPPKPATFTNSLGMKFTAVGDVQFSIYITTRKDFAAFAAATGLKSQAWRSPGFPQGEDHPVVNVSWHEADAFCKWLTKKERAAGLLGANEGYRLPTDLEWSKAVGLGAETGSTPEERDMSVPDVYPWGKEWPPPWDAGNYSAEDEATGDFSPAKSDEYRFTSPVGKFRVNAFGLYDMGGNVWQWVSDDWNAARGAKPVSGNIWQWMWDFWKSKSPQKTLRGASWYNGAVPLSLLSSCRISGLPDTIHDTYGFRIVKVTEPGLGRWSVWKTSICVLFAVPLVWFVVKRFGRGREQRTARAVSAF